MQNNKQLKVIKEIEKVRAENNTYWMELLRIAITSNPKKSKTVIKQINLNDKKVSRLLSKIF